MFGSMFGFGRGNSKDSHGGLSGSFGSHRGSTSSRRREELRRNLPRPSPEFVEWFRRPEFAATVGITFAFALAFALLTAWSRGVPRAFVGQIAIDSRINLAKQVVEEVRAHLPDKIFSTLIPRTVRLSEAPSFGKPILNYDPHGPGTIAYRNLAAEVIERFKLKG